MASTRIRYARDLLQEVKAMPEMVKASENTVMQFCHTVATLELMLAVRSVRDTLDKDKTQ